MKNELLKHIDKLILRLEYLHKFPSQNKEIQLVSVQILSDEISALIKIMEENT